MLFAFCFKQDNHNYNIKILVDNVLDLLIIVCKTKFNYSYSLRIKKDAQIIWS